MTLETWYVHCCNYCTNSNRYDIITKGPYSSVQAALNYKTYVKELYDLIEVNQNSFLKMPELV